MLRALLCFEWVLLRSLISFVPTCIVLWESHLIAMREIRVPILAGRVLTSSTHIWRQAQVS